MKAYFVDLQITESKTYEKRLWFSAESDKEAEKMIEDKFDHVVVEKRGEDMIPFKRMYEINSIDSVEDYKWKTKHWRDVEEMYLNTMLSYLNRSEEEIKNGDGEHWKADAEFYLILAELLEAQKYYDAYNHYRHADTWLREGVPDRVVDLFHIILVEFK